MATNDEPPEKDVKVRPFPAVTGLLLRARFSKCHRMEMAATWNRFKLHETGCGRLYEGINRTKKKFYGLAYL